MVLSYPCNPSGSVAHQPPQEVIDAYMGSSAGDQDDGGDDEDPQTQQDYDDFKKWLNKHQPIPNETAPTRVEAVDCRKAPQVSKPKMDVNWVCQLCKGDANKCHLIQDIKTQFGIHFLSLCFAHVKWFLNPVANISQTS